MLFPMTWLVYRGRGRKATYLSAFLESHVQLSPAPVSISLQATCDHPHFTEEESQASPRVQAHTHRLSLDPNPVPFPRRHAASHQLELLKMYLLPTWEMTDLVLCPASTTSARVLKGRSEFTSANRPGRLGAHLSEPRSWGFVWGHQLLSGRPLACPGAAFPLWDAEPAPPWDDPSSG